MKSKMIAYLLIGILLATLLVSCKLGPLSINFGPTSTPTLTPTLTPTNTPTRTPTPTPTLTPTYTPTPKLVMGIDKPVTVREVDLRVTQVSLMESYENMGQTFTPNPPYTHMIVLELDAEQPQVPCTWRGDDQILLSWTRNGSQDQINWGICISNTDGWVKILFAGYADMEDLTVIFPEGIEIPVQSLLD